MSYGVGRVTKRSPTFCTIEEAQQGQNKLIRYLENKVTLSITRKRKEAKENRERADGKAKYDMIVAHRQNAPKMSLVEAMDSQGS